MPTLLYWGGLDADSLPPSMLGRVLDFGPTDPVKSLVSEEKLEGEQAPAEDLLHMDGMDTTTAYALAKIGIITMDDLAEQAVDDLLDVDGIDEERAAQLIMTARAPWFEEQESSASE